MKASLSARYDRVASVAMKVACLASMLSSIVIARHVDAQASAAQSSTARSAFTRDSTAGLSWVLVWRPDWSRYKHPGECDAAVDIIQMTTLLRTGRYHPPAQQDTLATAARTAGQACASKFSPQTVSPGDLPKYLRLALRLNDLPLARRVLDTRLSSASTVDEKGSVIVDALSSFIGREPAQVAMADSLVQWLTTLGPRARWWRVTALQMLPATPAFDTAGWMHPQNEAIAEYAKLSHDDRLLSGIPVPYILNRWYESRELNRNPSTELCPESQRGLEGLGADTIRGVTTAMFWAMSQDGCRGEAGAIDQPVAPLSGGEWFIPGDTTGKTTLGWPRPGHVTLVVVEPLGDGRPTASLATYARLYERHAKDGLDLVLVHRRVGYVWGSGLLSPAVETQLIRWYDHDYLKLPFPIVVYDSAGTNAPGAMLIGRNVRTYAGPFVASETNEGVLEAFIDQALDAPVTQPPRAEMVK